MNNSTPVDAWVCRGSLVALCLAALAAPTRAGGLADSIAAGNQALRAGRVEEAKNRYAGGFVHEPEAPELHYSMGLAHLRAGERDKAAEFFRGAAERAEAGGRMGLAARAMYNLGIALAQGPGGSEEPEPAPAASPGHPGAVAEEPAAVLGAGPREPESAGGSAGPAGMLPGAAGGPDWKGALGAFEKAIRLDSSDLDAKYNYLRVRKLLDQMQQSSQDQEQGDSDEDESGDGEESKGGEGGEGEDQQGQGQEGEGQDEQDPRDQQGQGQGQDQDQSPRPSQGAAEQGAADDNPSGPESETDMDRQAMERFLDAVEAESKDQLQRFLRGRRASPRELEHDW